MWKSFGSPRRRRLQFDPLEGRQLLSGGEFPAPRPDFAPMTAGVTIVSGLQARGGWTDTGAPVELGRWGAPGPMSLDWAGRDTGPGGPMSFADFAWGVPGAGAESRPMDSSLSGAPGSGPAGGTSSDGGGHATALLIVEYSDSPYGAASGGWASGSPGGSATPANAVASSPSANNSGWPGGGPNGLYPGGFLSGARSQDAAALAASQAGPPSLLFLFLDSQWDRTDVPEPGAMPAAPLSTASAPVAPAVPSYVSPATNPMAAPVAISAASQVPAAGTTPTAHPHLVVSDSDAPAGDRVASLAAGSPGHGDARGALALRQTIMPNGNPAANRSADAPFAGGTAAAPDEAPPSPRGADLIAEALPLAGDAMERGLEEFVRQLEAVDVAGIVMQGPTPLVVATVSVAGAAATAVVVREVVRRRAVRRGDGRLRIVDPMGRELALSFPELPRSWSERY